MDWQQCSYRGSQYYRGQEEHHLGEQCVDQLPCHDRRSQSPNVDVPIKMQEAAEGKPIRIGQENWIGGNVFILANVTIGRHSMVGANSVVNRDISPYSVAVGAPPRIIKKYDFNLKQWVRVDGR